MSVGVLIEGARLRAQGSGHGAEAKVSRIEHKHSLQIDFLDIDRPIEWVNNLPKDGNILLTVCK